MRVLPSGVIPAARIGALVEARYPRRSFTLVSSLEVPVPDRFPPLVLQPDGSLAAEPVPSLADGSRVGTPIPGEPVSREPVQLTPADVKALEEDHEDAIAGYQSVHYSVKREARRRVRLVAGAEAADRAEDALFSDSYLELRDCVLDGLHGIRLVSDYLEAIVPDLQVSSVNGRPVVEVFGQAVTQLRALTRCLDDRIAGLSPSTGDPAAPPSSTDDWVEDSLSDPDPDPDSGSGSAPPPSCPF